MTLVVSSLWLASAMFCGLLALVAADYKKYGIAAGFIAGVIACATCTGGVTVASFVLACGIFVLLVIQLFWVGARLEMRAKQRAEDWQYERDLPRFRQEEEEREIAYSLRTRLGITDPFAPFVDHKAQR